MTNDEAIREFGTSPFYWGGVSIGSLVVIGFAWELWRGFSVEYLLFCLIGLGLVIWSLDALGRRVHLTTKGICVERPLRPSRCVDFRQLITVAEEGRINPVITLVYHPALADGLLDLDAAASLELPAVRAQAELFAVLQEKTPR